MKTYLIKITIWVLLLVYSSVASAQDDILSLQRNENGKIKFARFSQKENPERKMSDGILFLKTMLQAKEEDEFRLIRERTDKFGITTKRYQQYYKGIKVENAQYLLHGRNGYIEKNVENFFIKKFAQFNKMC